MEQENHKQLPPNTHVLTGFMKDPQVPGRHLWRITLGGLNLHVEAFSHQVAKEAAIIYWARGCEDPAGFERSIRARIAEKWSGGIKAELALRAPPIH